VRARLSAPLPADALVVFRVVLGTLVTISAIRFLAYGWVDELFVKPKFYFKYWGFSWVQALPAPWMHVLFVVLAVAGACFASGLFFRFAALTAFVGVAYVELIDVTNWLNHYYLLALLLLLTSFMPLGRAFSLDVWRRPARRLDAFPAWCTYLLRFQIGVVYVFAGLAKASSDWLIHAQPLNLWLSARTQFPLLGTFFDARATAYFFSWAGFLFDTCIVGFLMWRRTRLAAYAVVVVFHAMTWALFPIGMFPFIMTSAALVFMSPSWPAWFTRRFWTPSPSPVANVYTLHPALFAAGIAYCAVQLLMPLRVHLYGGNVLWDEQGMRFAWKVMVREKNGSITYLVESPREKRTWYVSPHEYLTDRQERELCSQPDLILQLAHHIKRDFVEKGHADVAVLVEALVSLNGRPAALMIDPNVDLSSISDGIAKASWIVPAPAGPPIHLKTSWSTAQSFLH
jgi:hypothetical protein